MHMQLKGWTNGLIDWRIAVLIALVCVIGLIAISLTIALVVVCLK